MHNFRDLDNFNAIVQNCKRYFDQNSDISLIMISNAVRYLLCHFQQNKIKVTCNVTFYD